MRDALMLSLAVSGLVLFVAGDILWLMRRRQNRPMNLRFTGTLIAAGITIFLIASLLR
ncbi:MAG: hypothetical protein O3B31_01095 [Chloroflexi bacterium]|nr:hypothetical protein [Chloroflexota bacterium]MDA1001936.1 hypothetical protein [Chloroflexota bacterium]